MNDVKLLMFYRWVGGLIYWFYLINDIRFWFVWGKVEMIVFVLCGFEIRYDFVDW